MGTPALPHSQTNQFHIQEVETTTTEKTSLTASLRKKWFKTKSSSQKSPSQQEAQPAACNSGMHVVHLTRRVPQSSAPRVTVGSLQQWLDTSAPPPYESALSFEATSAHNAHLEYCETTLTRMLEAAYLKVRTSNCSGSYSCCEFSRIFHEVIKGWNLQRLNQHRM